MHLVAHLYEKRESAPLTSLFIQKGDPKAAPCLLNWSSKPVFDVEHYV